MIKKNIIRSYLGFSIRHIDLDQLEHSDRLLLQVFLVHKGQRFAENILDILIVLVEIWRNNKASGQVGDAKDFSGGQQAMTLMHLTLLSLWQQDACLSLSDKSNNFRLT